MGEYTDKIKGAANKIKGKITGDESTRMKGEAQEEKGELKGTFERGKAAVKDVFEDEKNV